MKEKTISMNGRESFYNSRKYKNKMDFVCYTIQCQLDVIIGNVPKEIKQSHRLYLNELLFDCIDKIEQYKVENEFFYQHIDNKT